MIMMKSVLPFFAVFCFLFGSACSCSCDAMDPKKRQRHSLELERDTHNKMVAWGLPMSPISIKEETKQIEYPVESNNESVYDRVDVDVEESPDGGGTLVFFADGNICFSQKPDEQGKIKCSNPRTNESVLMDAGLESMPENEGVRMEPDAGFYGFEFDGKFCLSNQKPKEGLARCWDREAKKSVSVDTRDKPSE